MSVRSMLALALALAVTVASPARAQTAAPAAFAGFERQVSATKSAMMADPQIALKRANETARIATTLPATRRGQMALATALWLQGEAHLFLNDPAGATPLIEEALTIAKRAAPRTKLKGDLLRSRGAIAAMGGRIQDALRDFQSAYHIFTALHEARSQAMTLQDIGQIYWDAGDYERVLRYYAQSAEVYNKDPSVLLVSHNGRGEVLRKLHRLAEAEDEYHQSLREAQRLNSPPLKVRVLANLAQIQVARGRLNAAAHTVNQAIALTSFGEAESWRPFVWASAAMVARARGDVAGAAQLFDQAFAGLDPKTTPMPFKELHQLAANVYEGRGNDAKALTHLKAYQRLEGEARNLTASTSAQLLGARFDFANQNLKIVQLKQGQLQRDIQIERQQYRLRTVVLSGSLVAGVLVLILLLIGMWSLRRSRNATRTANVRLHNVNDALERALKTKTAFLATTSHEIRTPLNGILGMTQVLLTDRTLDGMVRDRIEVVHGAGETMRALVDDILDVAKMETGELTVMEEVTPLADIMRDAVSLWSGHAEAKALHVVLEVDDVPSHILSDATRLRQVIFNLMSNAVKFTEAGVITLGGRVAVEGDHEMLLLSVADTGIGIPKGECERVFEAFHQVDNSTIRQFNGTGLGLSICRRIVEAMGGTIIVHSVPGEGTCFTVRIPLRPVLVPDRLVSQATATWLGEARVMVVEANPLKRSTITALLEPCVGSVTGGVSDEDALAAIREGRLDHVLIDAASAGEDDHRTLRDLAALARQHDVRLSVLQPAESAASTGDLLLVGASQIILKPVGVKAMIAAMASLYQCDPAIIPVTAAAA